MTDAPPDPLPDLAVQIAALAARQARATGPLMALMNRMGGSVEQQMAVLPKPVRQQIETMVARGLEQGHALAARGRSAPDLGRHAAPAVAALTGVAGGMGGLATSLAELPVTITLILHTIRRAAEKEGFNPDDPWVRDECLRVFNAGSPLAQDDGINTAFLGARLALNGAALQALIARVAPRLAAALGQKLAAQAIPVLGAVSGAALNVAFLNHYRDLAEIRFALLRLINDHGMEDVSRLYAEATTKKPVSKT